MPRYFNFTIHGGIGSQLLRVLSCIGNSIYTGIKPSCISINISRYPLSQPHLLFHNSQTISSYLDFSPEIKIAYVCKPKIPDIPFDRKLIYSCLSALCSPSLPFYLTTASLESRTQDQVSCKDALWLRLGDRSSPIHFYDNFFIKYPNLLENLILITNDHPSLSSLSALSTYPTTDHLPINDFARLFHSPNIISQISGFSLAAFILSKHQQRFHLMPKSSHCPVAFPYLDKDWEFFTSFLAALHQAFPQKKYTIYE